MTQNRLYQFGCLGLGALAWAWGKDPAIYFMTSLIIGAIENARP